MTIIDRPPLFEQTERQRNGTKRMVAGSMAALSTLRSGESLTVGGREHLENLFELFDNMKIPPEDPAFSRLTRGQLSRQHSVWRVIEGSDGYLVRLHAAVETALETESPEWNSELEEVEYFLSSFRQKLASTDTDALL